MRHLAWYLSGPRDRAVIACRDCLPYAPHAKKEGICHGAHGDMSSVHSMCPKWQCRAEVHCPVPARSLPGLALTARPCNAQHCQPVFACSTCSTKSLMRPSPSTAPFPTGLIACEHNNYTSAGCLSRHQQRTPLVAPMMMTHPIAIKCRLKRNPKAASPSFPAPHIGELGNCFFFFFLQSPPKPPTTYA